MKLSLARYRSMLLVQYTFLIIDLLINTFSELFRFESVILLVIFVYAIFLVAQQLYTPVCVFIFLFLCPQKSRRNSQIK